MQHSVQVDQGAILTHTPSHNLVKIVGAPFPDREDGEYYVSVRFVDKEGEVLVPTSELSPEAPAPHPNTARLQSIIATKAEYVHAIGKRTRIQIKKIKTVQKVAQKRFRAHRVAVQQEAVQTASEQVNEQQKHDFYNLTLAAACTLSVLHNSEPEPVYIQKSTNAATLTRINAITAGIAKDNKIFLLDTGSQAHTTPDESDFIPETYHKYAAVQYVHDAGEGQHVIRGVGDVRQRIKTTEGIRDIVYTGVLHVQSFPLRILSAHKIRTSGYGIRLPADSPGYLEIQNGHRAFFTQKDGLEFLCGCTNPPPTLQGARVAAVTVPRKARRAFVRWVEGATTEEILQRLATPFPDDNQYHQRRLREQLATQAIYTPAPTEAAIDGLLRLHALLGHANATIVTRFARELLPHSAYQALGTVAIKYCEACQRSKQVHKGVPKKRGGSVQQHNRQHKRRRLDDSLTESEHTSLDSLLPTADKPWNYFSVDIVEQKSKSVTHNFKYCLICVDHHSNQIKVYGLTAIRDIDGPLQEHFLWVRKHHPGSIPGLQWDWERTTASAIHMKSDGASIFSTLKMRKIYAQMGVSHSRSAPHQQSRNGRTERAVRTIKHQAAALCAARGLGTTFWWFAWRHASLIHNLLPTKSNIGSLSPNEKVTGVKPGISHLHIFGADAWIVREKPQLGEDRGLPGMYVGYDPDGMENLIIIPPSTGGPDELRRFQTKHPVQNHQPLNIPHRYQLVVRKVAQENCTIDERVPTHVLDGTVRPASDLYIPYDDDDCDTLIIIGDTAVEMPAHDFGEYDDEVLDLDYHASHCTQMPSSCNCVGFRGDVVNGEPTLTRCAAVVIDASKPEPISSQSTRNSKQKSTAFIKATWDSVAGLFHHPKVLAVGECDSYKAAMRSEHADLYEAAKRKEQEQLWNDQTGVLTKKKWDEIPLGTKLFPSMMRFVLKMDENNEIKKAKARWCFRGDKQVHHLHYEDASANCPRWSTIRLFMADAAKLGRKIKVGDVTGAFLKGTDPNGRTLWMRAPPGLAEYDENGKEYVYQVHGNMYGMKQAPNVWAAYLNGWLDSKGFIRSKADPCVYTRRTKKGYKPGSSSASSSKNTDKSPASADSIATDPSRGDEPLNGIDIEYDNLSLLVYVDDLAYHGSSAEVIQQFETEFQEKFGDIGCHFPSLYLGANITQDAVGLHISNRAMIERMRDQYFPSKDGAKVKVNVYRSPTPFPSNGSALGGEVLLKDCPDVANGEPPITAPFSELVGALAYCALTCRPDIAFYTSQLARVQSAPGEVHF
jgi:hypothetical protein